MRGRHAGNSTACLAGKTVNRKTTWSGTPRFWAGMLWSWLKEVRPHYHALGRPVLGRKVPAGYTLPGRTSAQAGSRERWGGCAGPSRIQLSCRGVTMARVRSGRLRIEASMPVDQGQNNCSLGQRPAPSSKTGRRGRGPQLSWGLTSAG